LGREISYTVGGGTVALKFFATVPFGGLEDHKPSVSNLALQGRDLGLKVAGSLFGA